ncbi:radical SAM protein (plasmid) [Clostridium tyrobutyricum]|uniref:radical SAM protein n=1 Tax=Clostridium tyrobutyricum TaxID=1519 RepID=UPI0039F64F48
MKKSHYNFIFKNENDEYIAFNSMSCALAEIDKNFIDILNNVSNIKLNELDESKKQLVANMKSNGYIIDDNYNELKVLKYRNLYSRFSKEILSLVIAPTLNCNFKCIYCYETSNTFKMNQTTQNNLINFIKQKLSTVKQLNIIWYGGEPLLCKDIIFNLSERIINICDQNKVNYGAFIITNGYLIDEDIINNFKKYNITGTQITIDGPKYVHNTRRILKSGKKDNFEKVLSSVKNLKENKIDVHIRVNLDKNNVKHVDELLQTLKDEKMEDISIYFGQVTPLTKACKSVAHSCYTKQNFSEILIKLQKKLNTFGFKSYMDSIYYPSIKGNYCCADHINSFIIDPEGYIYKCMSDIGDKKCTIGNIKEKDFEKNIINYKFLDYMTFSAPESYKCKNCKLLPVCMGGCPSLRNNNKMVHCDIWNYNLPEIINNIYSYYKQYPEEFQKVFNQV